MSNESSQEYSTNAYKGSKSRLYKYLNSDNVVWTDRAFTVHAGNYGGGGTPQSHHMTVDPTSNNNTIVAEAYICHILRPNVKHRLRSDKEDNPFDANATEKS